LKTIVHNFDVQKCQNIFPLQTKMFIVTFIMWFYGDSYSTYFPKYMKYNTTQYTQHIPSKSHFVRAISRTVSRTGC